MVINVKRAYEAPSAADGVRFLVDRVWPRGITKARLRIDGWLKDVAPTAPLRKWFGHDPEKWDKFRRRYRRELDAHPEAWQPIVAAARRGPVTLVYGARDAEHNNAVALREYLQSRALRRRGAVAGRPRRRR